MPFYSASYLGHTEMIPSPVTPVSPAQPVFLMLSTSWYGKCPKISNTISDKMPHINSADPDQTAKEQSDQGLHC